MQHNRTEASGRYLAPQRLGGIRSVVVNRDSRALPRVRELFPQAQVFLWIHDQLNPGSKRARRLAPTAALLREMARDPGVRLGLAAPRGRGGPRATGHRQRGARAHDLQPGGRCAGARSARRWTRTSSCSSPRPTRGWSSPWTPSARCARAMPGCAWWWPTLATRRTAPRARAGRGVPGGAATGARARRGPRRAVHVLSQLRHPGDLRAGVRRVACARHPGADGGLRCCARGAGRPARGAAAAAAATGSTSLPPAHSAARLRAGPARLAAAGGLFEEFVGRIRAWREGGGRSVAPDPRFRLATVAARGAHWCWAVSRRPR